MKALRLVLSVAVVSVLFVGCASKTFPTWTPPPSGSPAASVGDSSGPAASGAQAAASTDPYGSVIPAFTPKAQLQPVPAGEVNTSYAPNVPPAATRHDQAIVEVHFDVVEGVKAIDPNGTNTRRGVTLHGDSRSPPERPGR